MTRIRPSVVLALLAVAALAGCGSGHAPHESAASSPAPVTSHPAPGTSSPAPAASSPGPSPTSSGAAKVCVTSASHGNCGPYLYPAISHSDGQNTNVSQDVWNPIPGWAQTLHTTGPGNWYVTADMPAGNTAVVSFPDVSEQYYYKNTLAKFSSIHSSFTEDMNPSSRTSAEAAYDIWLNDWHNEVMIQHDIVNRGSCPLRATAAFSGSGVGPAQHWNLCRYGSELIWQLAGKGERSGSVDILAMLTWLISHGYLPRGSGLTAISYGFEICSTGGRPETFTVSRFSISAGGVGT